MRPAMLLILPLLAATAQSPLRAQEEWTPSKELTINGRPYEVFQHGVKREWGYQAPQTDTFVVVHPRNERRNAPLYVVLHSAGHDVMSCLKCTRTIGNHDIYRSPDDHYALYLDCRDNPGDWWWGGMHADDPGLMKKNSGGDPTPVEKRVVDTVTWTIARYGIDPDRVYLCGNSMGGSGTLGIGMRHGDIFAAIKANVPAGIEHVSQRMYFPPRTVPAQAAIPDPPIVIDYSAQNDKWSFGHERLAKAMDERRYAFFFYWGPFGHANNSAEIMKVNDLIDSFDWLQVRRSEAYPVFTHASCNDKLPWPDDLKNRSPGQVNAFFRWGKVSDAKDRLEVSLYLVTASTLTTALPMPKQATADVSLRRVQNLRIASGGAFTWSFGAAKGTGTADAEGLITIPGLTITAEATVLAVSR